jgi:photosystem II stability/assembly factor-like uncharacterized protein
LARHLLIAAALAFTLPARAASAAPPGKRHQTQDVKPAPSAPAASPAARGIVSGVEFSALRIVNTGLPRGIVGVTYPNLYQFKLQAKGGAPPYSFALTGAVLPGITMNSAGEFTGTATAGGSFAVTVQVTDGLGTLASKPFTVDISIPGAPPDWTPRGISGGAVKRVRTSPSYATDDTLFAAGVQGELFRSTDRAAGWTRAVVNPAKADKPIDDFILSPAYDQNSNASAATQTVFALSLSYGVWKSVNHGATFSASGNGLPCFGGTENGCTYPISTALLGVSPGYATDNTVFLLVDGYYLGYNYLAYRSTDGGANWSLRGTVQYAGSLYDFQVSPNFTIDQTLMAVANSKVYLSPNAGGAWGEIFPVNYPTYASQALFSPDYATDQTILVRAGYSVYRSTDGGETFLLASGLSIYHMAATRRAGLPPLWYMIPTYIDYSGHYYVLRSEDYGTTAVPLATASLPSNYYYNVTQGLAVSPERTGAGPDLFYFGETAGLYSSYDDGYSFNVRGLRLSAQKFHALGGSGSTLVAGGEYGWYRSGDSGRNWVRLSNPGIQFSFAALSPNYASDHTLLLQENNSLYRSTDGGTNFTYAATSYVYRASFVTPFNPATGTVLAGGNGVLISGNGGASFSNVSGSSTACPVGGASPQYIYGFAASPNFTADQTLFAAAYVYSATGGLCKSTDGGANWTQKPVDGIPRNGLVTASPVYNDGGANGTAVKTLLLSSWDNATQTVRIYRSTDGGDTWTAAAGQPAQGLFGEPMFSPRFATDNTAFIITGSTAYFGNAGYLPTGLPTGLWRSSDGGATFAPLGAGDGLLGRKVTGLYLLPSFDGSQTTGSEAIAVTEGAGVWRSTDGGRTFGPVDGYKFISDLLNVLVSGPGTLYAGTQDQGIFKSTDNGESYVPFSDGLPAAADIRAIALPAAYPTYPVSAITGLGLWRFNGSSWVQTPTANAGSFTSIVNDSPRMYAARTDGLSLVSNDSGYSWASMDAAQTDLCALDVADAPAGISATPDRPAGANASLWAVSLSLGPRYSTDSGATWWPTPGAGDYTLPGGLNWSIVKAQDINPLNGWRKVVAGANGALYRTVDGGDHWRLVSGPGSGLEATSRNFSAVISAPTPMGTTDLLVGATGATTGGVYLSGDDGEHWTQVNQGFDPSNLNITTLAKTSCSGCPVQYYSGTYGSGVYTRTIAVVAPPSVSGWCFTGTGCACGTAAMGGPEQGGDAFRICGSGFQPGAVIEFDGVAAAGCSYVSASAYTCTGTAPHVPGGAVLRIRNPDTRTGYAGQLYNYAAGSSRAAGSLHIAKAGGDALLTYTCTGCTTPPPRVYRSQNAAFTLNVEQFAGGAGSYTNTGALASGTNAAYFWNVE